MSTRTTISKYARLQDTVREINRVLVAFSGGVDSTFLLKCALDTLGPENVLAVVAASESFPAQELDEAKALAEALGARYLVTASDELRDPRYVANPPDRCYYCKRVIFSTLQALGRRHGYTAVIDGANADDRDDWRPGARACRELGIRSPLMEVGLTKAEIRALSHAQGLPTWDKPSYACLASRIPYGTPITREALAAIQAAEAFLRTCGFPQVRVRHHGEVARIEVLPEEIARFLDPEVRRQVSDRLHSLGYRYVALDLQGYRMGSMNEGLRPDA